MKDFSKERAPSIDFKIGRHEYHAVVGLPAQVMLDFVTKFGAITGHTPVDQQITAFSEILGMVLEDSSMELFRENMRSKDRVDMIEFDQLESVLTWLLEEYGLRPTELPSPSAPGQPDPEPGTNWTDSTPAVVSISSDFLSIDS